MKAILVIDIPDDKKYANDKWFLEGEEIGIRNMTENGEFGEYYEEIDDWEMLELKPMPSKMKVDYDTIASCEVTEKVVAMGWNACIDGILGGNE